jgi:Golgi transport complex subunit 5
MSNQVVPDLTRDPYADYASLLSPSFHPSIHASQLVLATNDPSDRQTDLTSPMQRIQYDLEEVNRRIDQTRRQDEAGGGWTGEKINGRGCRWHTIVVAWQDSIPTAQARFRVTQIELLI